MRIAIIGTGGVGGYFGAQLAASGEDVIFIARGEHLEAMRSRGLTVESDHAPAHISPAPPSSHCKTASPRTRSCAGTSRTAP